MTGVQTCALPILDSARGADGFGITVSYWASLEAIAQWRAHLEHQAAQTQGKHTWYAQYELRIALVERAYRHDARAMQV